MIALHGVMAFAMTVSVGAAGVVVGGAVLPQGPVAPTAVSVRSNDLDLQRPVDAQILFERVAGASIQACGGTPDFRDTPRIAAFDQCRKAVISRTVRQLNQPLLTEVAEANTLTMRIAIR
jgi:UrcA family protein